MTRRTLTAKIAGETYQIPEMWIVGFCRGQRATVLEAIQWWHEQEMMERQWKRQQRRARKVA